MSVKRIFVSCAVVMLVTVAGLSAAKSDVADAVMKGDKAAVRALLQQRVDVNAPQADGATALHWAVYRADVDTANVLITALRATSISVLAGRLTYTVHVSAQTVYIEPGVSGVIFATLATGDEVRVFATGTGMAGTINADAVVILSS